MNLQRVSLIVALLLVNPVSQARTWTDTNGRALEADMVSADATSVSVLMAGGRQFKLPLASLSQGDQDFVENWLEEHAAEKEENGDLDEDTGGNSVTNNDQGGTGQGGNLKPQTKPKAGQMTFDGQALITGGRLNKYEYPYDEKRLGMMKKWKSDDTGYKIALAVPHDFNPSKPQKVFIANTAVNNAKQGLSGNFGVVGFYAKKCVENGWVCMAYDTNLGRKNHDADLYMAFEKLNEVWSGIKDWEFAVGGFSGGAKACWKPAGYLVKNDYKVIGAMLSGVNEDFSDHYRKYYKAAKAGYKDIKVLLSNGKWDEVAQVSKQENMEKSLKRNGMRNIKKTMHDGKHNLDYGQIDIALQWFNEKGDD